MSEFLFDMPEKPRWIDQREQAIAERDKAMQQVEENADAAWMAAAEDAVLALAKTGDFTTDQVWFLLAEWKVAPPREPRALGPVMMRLVRSGAIKDTGRVVKSVRRHATRIPVYCGVAR